MAQWIIMPFIRIKGFKELLYVPEEDKKARKKHPCPDCFSCQMCSDERCEKCLRNKAGRSNRENNPGNVKEKCN